MNRTLSLIAAAALSLPFVNGCIVSDSDPVYYGTGTLVVDWSIDLAQQPVLCDQSGAYDITIQLTGPSGGTFTQDCAAFATSIPLSPGNYSGSAFLSDARGQKRTTAVSLGSFAVYSGDAFTIPIDFPSYSFY